MNTKENLRIVRDEIMVSAHLLRASYKNRAQTLAAEAHGKLTMAASIGIITTEIRNAGDYWIEQVYKCRVGGLDHYEAEEKTAWAKFDKLIRGE